MPPERTGLFHDLTHIKFRYVVLVLACIGAGSYLRSEIFSGEMISQTSSHNKFLKVRGPNHWETVQKQNSVFIENLADGTSPTEVIAALGQPQFHDIYANDVEIMYYRTHHEHDDMYTTRDETTPLVFIEGKLVNHSRSAHGPAFDQSKIKGGSNWEKLQKESAATIAGLNPGATRSEIIAKLGRPDFDDIVNSDFEVLSYRTRSVRSDGYTTRDETTPLVFEGEKLIAIGRAGETHAAGAAPGSQSQPAPPENPAPPDNTPGKDTDPGTGSF